jgi:hypothetical protein
MRERMEISTKWRKMFSIEDVIQFDLEHWRDCVGALLRIDHSGIVAVDGLTFTGPNLSHGRRGIAKPILCKGNE